MAVTIPTVDAPLDPPSRGSPGPVFRAAADAFMARWPLQITQIRATLTGMNAAGVQIAADAATAEQARIAALAHRNDAQTAAATALNAPGTIASSTTSFSIAAAVSAGTQAITIQAGKALVPGLSVSVAATASAGNRIKGVIESYDSGSGALALREVTGTGSGTFAAWSVGLTADASLPVASVEDVWAGTNNTKAITAAVAASLSEFRDLTDAATITWDITAKGLKAKVTLGGNRIVGLPSGLKIGDVLTLLIINPSSGGPFTPTFAANWDFSGITPSFNTTAGKINRVRGEVIQLTPSVIIDASFKRAG